MNATGVRTHGPAALSAVSEADSPIAARPWPAIRSIQSDRSGWCWTTDWGPSWDSPDVAVVDYVAGPEALDGC